MKILFLIGLGLSLASQGFAETSSQPADSMKAKHPVVVGKKVTPTPPTPAEVARAHQIITQMRVQSEPDGYRLSKATAERLGQLARDVYYQDEETAIAIENNHQPLRGDIIVTLLEYEQTRLPYSSKKHFSDRDFVNLGNDLAIYHPIPNQK